MATLTLSEALWNIHLTGYLQATTVTILVYDYCLTLAREVSFVWNSRWSTINVLYLLTRYMPFVDSAFLLSQGFLHSGPNIQDTCHLIYRVDACLFVLGIGISEVILMLRILVIWDKDRRLLIGLPIFFAMVWIAMLVFMYYFLQSVHFSSIQTPGVTRCYGTKNATMLLIGWVLFMAFEIVMFVLLLIRGIQRYSLSQQMPLVRIVYRDGILFYFYIVVISVSNVIVILTLPGIALLLTPFVRAMHSVLTVRFVLELRQVFGRDDDRQEKDTLSNDMASMESISFARTENGSADRV